MEVVTTDGSACPTCGRERWQGDRFCATCGNDFGETSADAGVIDVDHLTARTADAQPERSNWRDALKGLGALGAIVLVLVGGLYLASRSDSTTDEAGADDTTELAETDGDEPADDEPDDEGEEESPATDAEDEPPIEDEDVTPVPATPEPTPRPTRVPAPSPLLELLETADVGARFLLTHETRGVIAHDLETGSVERVWSTDGAGSLRSPDEQLLLRDGLIDSLFPYDNMNTTKYVPWNPDEQQVELPGSFVAAFMDPDAGRVLIVSPSEATGELIAVAVESGEQRAVPLDPSLLELGFGWWVFAMSQAAEAPYFVVGLQEDTWGWGWDAGWTRLADGAVQQIGEDFIVVRQCTDPQSCSFSASDFTGDTLVDSLPWGVPLWSSLSPDGQTVASLTPPGSVGFGPSGELTLTDLSSGAETLFGINAGFPGLRWSPNGNFLLVLSYEEITVIDARSNEVVGEARTGSSISLFSAPIFTDEIVMAAP